MVDAHGSPAQQPATSAPNTAKDIGNQELPASSPMSMSAAAQEDTKRGQTLTFFDLPRELRDIVYEFATRDVEVWPGLSKPIWLKWAGETPEHIGMNTGLLRASKQFRSEVLFPYLQNTLFTFDFVKAAWLWFWSVPTHLRPSLGQLRLAQFTAAQVAQYHDNAVEKAKAERKASKWTMNNRTRARMLSFYIPGEVKIMRQAFKATLITLPKYRVEVEWQEATNTHCDFVSETDSETDHESGSDWTGDD